MIPWPTSFPGAELLLVAMAFAWGSILGSFINVVIHRVPRGESVVTHGSRCPACAAPIRPRDNIPILGWLLLGGRCRDCGVAISAGYPAVEAFCGVIAAVIAAAELAGTGSPLLKAARPGIDRLLAGDVRIALAWVVHTIVSVAMVAWSLTPTATADPADEPVRHDRHGAAERGASWLVPAVIVIVTLVPAIGPPGFLADGTAPSGMAARLATMIASCLGTIAGTLSGTMTGHRGDRSGLAAFGAAAGWQAVLVVTVLTAVIRLIVGVVLPRNSAQIMAAATAPAVAAGLFAAWSTIAEAWTARWGAVLPG